MSDMRLIKTFDNPGDFAATDAAIDFLRNAGFAIGSMCGDQPRGVMFGDYTIAKWRNLTVQERAACHGLMTGSPRHGPIQIVLFDHAPFTAMRAFHRAAVVYAEV